MKFRSIEVVELIQFVSVSSYNTGKLYTHGDYIFIQSVECYFS